MSDRNQNSLNNNKNSLKRGSNGHKSTKNVSKKAKKSEDAILVKLLKPLDEDDFAKVASPSPPHASNSNAEFLAQLENAPIFGVDDEGTMYQLWPLAVLDNPEGKVAQSDSTNSDDISEWADDNTIESQQAEQMQIPAPTQMTEQINEKTKRQLKCVRVKRCPEIQLMAQQIEENKPKPILHHRRPPFVMKVDEMLALLDHDSLVESLDGIDDTAIPPTDPWPAYRIEDVVQQIVDLEPNPILNITSTPLKVKYEYLRELSPFEEHKETINNFIAESSASLCNRVPEVDKAESSDDEEDEIEYRPPVMRMNPDGSFTQVFFDFSDMITALMDDTEECLFKELWTTNDM